MKKNSRILILHTIANLLLFTVVYWIVYVVYQSNNFLAGIVLIIYGIVTFIDNIIVRKKYIELRSIFILIWCTTLGLGMIRLLEYQIEWSREFFAITYFGMLFFILGLELGNIINVKIKKHIVYENKIFRIVIVCTFIALIMWILSYLQTGIIAFFSSSSSAYREQYSRFYVIQVGMLPVAVLGIYYLNNYRINLKKRIIVYMAIAINIFILPMLSVSRGVFVTGFMLLVPTLYYTSKNKKRLIKFFLMAGILFIIITNSRNYSDSYLTYFFKPNVISVCNKEFSLSGKEAFIYGYLTVSHDNFNYNLISFRDYSYGGRLLQPFNVILRSNFIRELVNNSKLTNISHGLTTHNMMGVTYYDFGKIGVIVILLIWGLFFGIIETYYHKNKTPISGIVYGGCLINTSLSFFTSWMTDFTIWMWWGFSIILYFSLYKIKIYNGAIKK